MFQSPPTSIFWPLAPWCFSTPMKTSRPPHPSLDPAQLVPAAQPKLCPPTCERDSQPVFVDQHGENNVKHMQHVHIVDIYRCIIVLSCIIDSKASVQKTNVGKPSMRFKGFWSLFWVPKSDVYLVILAAIGSNSVVILGVWRKLRIDTQWNLKVRVEQKADVYNTIWDYYDGMYQIIRSVQLNSLFSWIIRNWDSNKQKRSSPTAMTWAARLSRGVRGATFAPTLWFFKVPLDPEFSF